jgi:HAD superfamily hydrolase (TIGR01509 family)
MPYAAVIFDMGDVFIDYPLFVKLWEAKLVDVYVGRRPYWVAFNELLTDFGLDGAQIDELTLFARQRAAQAEHRTLFEGVAETLARLKQLGTRLAVLSDTESREPRVRARMADLGIESYFDAVVTSIDIGHVKPEAAAFAAALERLGTTAGETLFVGHDEDELAGAMACGLVAVAYNHDGDVPADHRLAQFSELYPLVATGDKPATRAADAL